jgi:hypothetical protein
VITSVTTQPASGPIDPPRPRTYRGHGERLAVATALDLLPIVQALFREECLDRRESPDDDRNLAQLTPSEPRRGQRARELFATADSRCASHTSYRSASGDLPHG